MDERLEALYKEVASILKIAPGEDDCTDNENIMYAEMENLKESMLAVGYGN